MTQFFESLTRMTPMELFAQALGIIAMALLIFSFQFKKNVGHFIMQALGCGLFCIHYLLLGLGGEATNWSGFMMDALSATRALILLGGEKTNKLPFLIAQLVAAAAALVLTITVFREVWWLALFPFAAQTANLLGTWTRHPRKMRWVQLGVVSPCWLAYNILITPMSIGGIICETFNMVSVVVYFIRMHLEKKRAETPAGSV